MISAITKKQRKLTSSWDSRYDRLVETDRETVWGYNGKWLRRCSRVEVGGIVIWKLYRRTKKNLWEKI